MVTPKYKITNCKMGLKTNHSMKINTSMTSANPNDRPTSVPFGEYLSEMRRESTKSDAQTVLAILSPHITTKNAPKSAPPRYPNC